MFSQRSNAWRVLVAALLLLGLLERWAAPSSGLVASSRLSIYALQLTSCAGFAAFAWYFGGRSSLLGPKFLAPEQLFGDVARALLLVAVVLTAESCAQPAESRDATVLFPVTGLEKMAWCCVALVIAASEELVYRGYLLRELTAATTPLAAACLQALLFGIAHDRQGAAATTRFALYGFVFALVTARRRSLLPCILAHTALDVCAGLAR